MKKKLKKIKIIAIIFLGGLLSTVSIGFVDNYFEISKNLDIFATLFREVNIYYVDKTNPGSLIEKGIEGMLGSLDPYTVYIPESEIEDHQFTITGQYGGIGALIRKKNEQIIIAEPYEGFPAHKAGLMAGDVLLEVNEVKMEGKNTGDVSKILKGQKGSPVKLLVKREGEPKPFELNLIRDEIVINSVPYYGMLNDHIGYIMLNSFTDNAFEDVKKALLKMKENKELQGVILDLRGNPGGLLREAVNIVNLFVEKGQDIVSTKGKLKEWDKVHRALNAPVDLNIPLAVLVNRQSASASEIVSGAIQDLDRGVVIGQKTFGKGLVQQTLKLSYNAQLKVTTAKYYIPSGRCIQTLDYTHRNEDGSVGNIPDSLITEFKTKKGRNVYDGGGINPDITTLVEKPSIIASKLASQLLIFDFASMYRRSHPEISSPKKFILTDDDYKDFMGFIKDKDYQYTSQTEKTLEELKNAAIKEQYYSESEQELEALKKKFSHNNEQDLLKFKSEIVGLIKNEIIVRYYFDRGRIEASLSDDVDAIKAVEVLNDKILYTSIIDGTYQVKAKTEDK